MPKHAKTKDTCCSSTGDGLQRGKRVRLVPFARGFKQRDESARLNAIGFKISDIPKEFSCGLHGSSSLPSSTSSSNIFFNPIPRPTCEDDWLAQYNEDGQTYKQFLAENPWLSKRKIKFTKQRFCSSGTYVKDKYPDGKVYVMQLGEFDHCIEFLDLVDYTSRFLCLPVEALPPLQLELTGGKVDLCPLDTVKRLSLLLSV